MGRAPFLKNKIFVANNIYIYIHQFIHFHLNNQTDCLAIVCVINFFPDKRDMFLSNSRTGTFSKKEERINKRRNKS